MPVQTLSEACTDPSVTATVPRNRWKRSDVFGSQRRLVTLTDKPFELNSVLVHFVEICVDKTPINYREFMILCVISPFIYHTYPFFSKCARG